MCCWVMCGRGLVTIELGPGFVPKCVIVAKSVSAVAPTFPMNKRDSQLMVPCGTGDFVLFLALMSTRNCV
jgi:hypothetical protein